jgi:hypothetical protein
LKGDFRCNFAVLTVEEGRSGVAVVSDAGSGIDASLKIEEVERIAGSWKVLVTGKSKDG